MLAFVTQVLDFLTIEFKVLFTAAMPIIELRGAIPLGVSLGMHPIHAAVISFFGSMIPVPFILFFIRPIFNWMKHMPIFEKLINRLTHKSMNKSHRVQKYGAWGLILFVAIPLPGTGIWSGSLAAALLDIRFKWAFPAIFVGNLIAAVAITLLSYGVLNVVS